MLVVDCNRRIEGSMESNITAESGRDFITPSRWVVLNRISLARSRQCGTQENENDARYRRTPRRSRSGIQSDVRHRVTNARKVQESQGRYYPQRPASTLPEGDE